jgi:hypothetical protein
LRAGIARGRSCASVWLSHEEKRPWVELSIGGQPWPELELHGRPWECSQKRGEKGKERGRGGSGWRGARRAIGGGGCRREAQPGCSSVRSPWLLYVRRKEEGEEKRREREEKKKGREKKKR